jgi:O-antigen/teichoic acid export membrane protein
VEETATTPSLKTQSAWLLFAKAAGFVFSFLLPFLVVRFIAQDGVGVYRQIFQVVMNAAVILPLGVGMSAYYYLSRDPEQRASAVFNILLFNAVVGGIAFVALLLFPGSIGGLFHSVEITRLAPIVGLVIWFWITGAFLETVAVANQEPKLATMFIILAQFTKALLMVGAVVIFSTVESILYAALFQGIIQTLVLLVYLNSRFPRFWKSFNFAFLREQLAYALPYGFAGLLWTLQTDIHNYFVGYRFSAADYAIYAYGCFQLPLVMMLSESVSSVLIPRMSALQAAGDKREMIRLTTRAMQKLAFFFMPMYVFLMITAHTFVVTLFTRNYERAVPIFMINLTIMLIYIWISDPIVRAFKELGRFLLILRVCVLIALIAALYFGIRHFELTGMIGIVVVAAVLEKIASTIMIARKLGVRASDAMLLAGAGKTAICALVAGAATWLLYFTCAAPVNAFGANLAQNVLGFSKISVIDFVSGSMVLGLCFGVFAPIYLVTANYFGVIEDEEKESISSFVVKLRHGAARLFGRGAKDQI